MTASGLMVAFKPRTHDPVFMRIAKDGIRSIVRVGFDGRVFKTFRGTDADKRFANEIRVLKVLEERGCDYVPQLLDSDEATLTITTTNCGKPVESIGKSKCEQLFAELKEDFGIVHDDPFDRNVTYHARMGRFCIIDFELAEILEWNGTTPSGTDSDLMLSWFGMTIEGVRKKGNEDALAAFAAEAGSARELQLNDQLNIANEGVILAVSDGMGGVTGGGYASNLVVNELTRFLPAQMGSLHTAADPHAHLESAVLQLNEFINRVAESTPGVEGMGATLVCGLFSRRQLHFAHVGDSRIYCFHDGNFEQLTYDDSRVGRMFRKGEINEREARNHPARNSLEQVIGNKNLEIKPQIGSQHLKPGMWFVFCSDGVVDGLWNSRIERELAKSEADGRTIQETAEVLMKEAVDIAGKDDTTLFVARISGTGKD